jgi:hypothetical protein
MKRFLMLLAVAAVAGGMYVAAAPGRSLHAGPTWKQFTALQKQVKKLKKQLGQVKTTATNAAVFIEGCFLTSSAGVAPVSVFGDTAGATPTWGYQFTTTPGGQVGSMTALDIDGSTSPGGFLQAVDPSCVGTGAAAHFQTRSGSRRLPTLAERAR